MAYRKPASASYENGLNLVYQAVTTDCAAVESAYTYPYFACVSDIKSDFSRVLSTSPAIDTLHNWDQVYNYPDTTVITQLLTLGAQGLAYFYPPAQLLDPLITAIDTAASNEFTPDIDDDLAHTHCRFGLGDGTITFDDYPFLLGYVLASNQSGYFTYTLGVTVEFAVLDDGGLHYVLSQQAFINNIMAYCTIA